MNTLFWLTDDLRLEDNPALVNAAQDDTLTIIFCIEEQAFRTDKFGNLGMGALRWKFVQESLLDLQKGLAKHEQTLNLLSGKPSGVLNDLLQAGRFDRVVRTRQHNSNELLVWQYLRDKFPAVLFDEYDSSTLYPMSAVCFTQSFPATFSQFRRSLDAVAFRKVVHAPERLPAPLEFKLDSLALQTPSQSSIPHGGSSAGRKHVDAYFGTLAASTYKKTRNDLSGEHSSTGFSSWLARGCISPTQIFYWLGQYESINGANESTGWITFELMWREFFRWHARHHGSALFEFTGINGQRPLTTFYRERYLKWCDGNTPWPIVNACMRELNETGLLSNRGRQIAASCLVNELGLDWRCGAGYFEERLIDYDPCSNWGNWQYIAGVGSDPRGGRHFNLEKQAETWDPEGTYRGRWGGKGTVGPLDSQDYYGFPIEARDLDSS
jgi:deoxyribodipyrimidine photo-lyase